MGLGSEDRMIVARVLVFADMIPDCEGQIDGIYHS